jgi:hypothetical protein
MDAEIRPKKTCVLGLGLYLEFNSIHFGIEINKCLKFLTLKNFFKKFQESQKFLDQKTFGCQKL